GDTRGQSWAGLFRDIDGNHVMEFADLQTALKPERWTPELNFLAWQPATGARAPELPAQTKVRISFQWSEAHDPAFLRNGEDVFRAPLAGVGLIVLRQRDPSGAKLPADDMEVVAFSTGLPQRLVNRPEVAVYEQTVEFTVDAASRYALRVEGTAPQSTRPPGAATLPGAQKQGEMRARIFVQTLAGAGRALFADYSPAEGTV